jgi:N-acetylmuramoyl-L-alanine amidase
MAEAKTKACNSFDASKMSTVPRNTACEKQKSTEIKIPMEEREVKRHFRLATVVGGILLASVFVWIGTFNLYHTENTVEYPATNSTHVTQAQWMAQSTEYELTPLCSPVSRVIIAHTATEGCSIRVSISKLKHLFSMSLPFASQTECILRTRYIQMYHIETMKFDDIGYNFLIGGDGDIYDGQGWNLQGAHTKGFNSDSVGIALIGNFIHSTPPSRQLNATLSLIHEGLRSGKLTKDFRLFGANQLVATKSPGAVLIEILKSWPHYSNEAKILMNI